MRKCSMLAFVNQLHGDGLSATVGGLTEKNLYTAHESVGRDAEMAHDAALGSRGACNDEAHPFHCHMLSAPSTSANATTPGCVSYPPLAVAAND